MPDGPDIVRAAALLGDPARANMLTALMGGQALTAGELAREAGVTAQTASSHLARLEAGGLITVRQAGRHRYFALAGPDVAAVLEGLMSLAARAGHSRTRPGPRDPALRRARRCYDHLAGELGVAMFEALVADGRLALVDDHPVLTETGEAFVRGFGLDPETLRAQKRPLCRSCLDWSARRSHLAGTLGAGLLSRMTELGWARLEPGSRVVTFSKKGLAAFEAEFPTPHP
ncbi:DNA-binding transcriptional ArsR family regulator [Caulobacter ginsengisoli]|uniref:DNA-binding transcriptional ArsR family regulator n=1 Tax=Caulobacter ginsengisoli TaxID=400775 RepID=A0ABU0ITF5_9CAUL|nr:winged helix-turn-helix domain-containing protein [Caulobacter ginsengisoli]MDQ0465274.1 DNA-binding transcriptional ArsR family regulator [Caulobacter ginsengisoli]